MSFPVRQLIVNADDFGRAPGIVAGITAGRERGIVTSASLMVRWPAAEIAARLAREDPGMSVGLHVDLGEWVHSADSWSATYEVCDLSDATAVEAEIDRQLSVFRTLLERDPTHLDSHQNVHGEGAAKQVMRRLADSLGVPLRGDSAHVSYLGGFYGQTGTGEKLHENITPSALIDLLDALPPGVTELGCHPGDGIDDLPPYSSERLIELETLCDPTVRQALEERSIELVSYYAVVPHGAAEPVRYDPMQRTKIRSTDGPAHDDLTFELERFAWAAPDRLEVTGAFSGVGEAPLDAPMLVLRNGDEDYRLAPLADNAAHAPVNGESWGATFGWQDAPVAFSLAELHMGSDVVIELPEPAVKGPSDPRPRLRAKRSVDTSGADAAEDSAIAVTPADAGDPPQLVDELVAAQERLADVQAVIGRARAEVLVARAELEESRQQSAADEERFRAGLAAIRASADDALALEQKAAEEMQERLALGDSEIGQLRQSLERAEAERASETAEARSQQDQLGAELEETRQDAAGVRTRAETAEAAAAQAQTELASVRAQLSTIRAALDGGS